MINSGSLVYYLGYLAVFCTCIGLTNSESNFLANGLMNSTLKEQFLNLFCNDPGNFALYIDEYGKFRLISPSYAANSSIPPGGPATVQCDFNTPEVNDSFAIVCRVVDANNETFSELSECSLQEMGSRCLHKCVYVWTPRLNETYLMLDVGPCGRSEVRFTSNCLVSDDAMPVDEDTSGDPMKVLALCIIFLQTSIISVFVGFMLFIDII